MERGRRESGPAGQACLLFPDFDKVGHIAQREGAVLGEIGDGSGGNGAKHRALDFGVKDTQVLDFLVAVDDPGALGMLQTRFALGVETGHELLILFVEFLVPALESLVVGRNQAGGGIVFFDIFAELHIDGMFFLGGKGESEEQKESEEFHGSLYKNLGGKVHPVSHLGLTGDMAEDL